MSLGKTLDYEALAKAVAVKLIDNKRLKLKSRVSLSSIKHSDVVICRKK